jgi:hypothetical protein
VKMIFCADPLDHKRPDPLYAVETEAASAAGFACSLLNFEALVDEQDAEAAVRRIPQAAEPELAIYRGWMLRPAAYARLGEILAARGFALINSPEAYQHCHYLPASYPVIEGHTPRSVWLAAESGLGIERIMAALRPFGAAPLVVKDYVKSRKHEWAEACYIPSASDQREVNRVVTRFLELQGPDLNEGLVFREFVSFEPLAQHTRSGMPLTKEFRLFFLDGEPLLSTAYWDEGDYSDLQPPVERFQQLARRVQSRFFTMDVAKRLDGDWMIIELGDGQVAGLPEQTDVPAFYRALAARLAHF